MHKNSQILRYNKINIQLGPVKQFIEHNKKIFINFTSFDIKIKMVGKEI
jgi:hypothetical protein